MKFAPSFYQSLNLNGFDTEAISFPSELFLQGLILQNPNLLAFDKGSEPSVIDNELSFGKGKNNRIDVVIRDDDYVGIVELKKHEIDKKAFDQLTGYLDKSKEIIDELIKNNTIDAESIKNENIYGVLVGTEIKSEIIQEILDRNKDSKNLKIFVIILKRYRTSNDQIFITSNAIISPESTRNDYSKYKFNGKIYGKGRLVLAVIKYLAESNKVDIQKIKEEFPTKTQGTYEIIKSIYSIEEDAQNSTKDKRYFMNDPIEISGVTYAVTSQWGKGNIDRFIERAKKLDCEIEKI